MNIDTFYTKLVYNRGNDHYDVIIRSWNVRRVDRGVDADANNKHEEMYFVTQHL